MDKEKLKEYIQKKLQEGYTLEEIKKELLKRRKKHSIFKLSKKHILKLFSLVIIFLLICLVFFFNFRNYNYSSFKDETKEMMEEKILDEEDDLNIHNFDQSMYNQEASFFSEIESQSISSLIREESENLFGEEYSQNTDFKVMDLEKTDKIYSRPNCNDNSQCNTKCENCKLGKTYCAIGISECVECLEDFDCKDGFVCYAYQCVKKLN